MDLHFGLTTALWILIFARWTRGDITPTPLTTCCFESQYYAVGFDRCVEWDKIPNSEFPPIYDNSVNKNRTLSGIDFVLRTDNLTSSCPSGHVVKSSTEFRIFKSGALKTPDGIERPTEEFCVNRVPSGGDNGNALFAVRYCIPDPCVDAKCVRKCCPIGMTLNETAKICQPSPVPFVVSFHDESGTPTDSRPSAIVHDGSFPNCRNGMYFLRPALNNTDDEFYILPDGKLHMPDAIINSTMDEYCVENIINSLGSVRRKSYKNVIMMVS